MTEACLYIAENCMKPIQLPEVAAQVRDFVLAHDGVNKAAAELDRYIDKAVSCLAFLPEGPASDQLVALARYIGERNL